MAGWVCLLKSLMLRDRQTSACQQLRPIPKLTAPSLSLSSAYIEKRLMTRLGVRVPCTTTRREISRQLVKGFELKLELLQGHGNESS